MLSANMGLRATQLVDPALMPSLGNRGYTFFQDVEPQRLLDYFNANASTDLAGNISLRSDPRQVEVVAMSTLIDYGCEFCRNAIYGGHSEDLPPVAVEPAGPAFLYHCPKCGTYWDYTISMATPLTKERAHQLYKLDERKAEQ